ncbi:hypothetical protein H8356DRAFT_1437348 [Neocallimastix lanati (nom. inval.)]|nr:hypothetical protein H8356DRAFT_1437348 [Neocallimastix sp. JGI-2020a]
MNNIIKGIDDISREIIMKNAFLEYNNIYKISTKKINFKLEEKLKLLNKKVRKEKRKVKRENDKCINIIIKIIKILIIKISNNRKDMKTVEHQLKFNLVIDKNYFNSILIIKINIRNIKELETKGTTIYVKINLIGLLDNEILDFKDI